MDLMKEEHKSPEYLKLNPNGLIPTMVEGDFILYESHAILRYLADSWKVEDHWYPKDLWKWALVNRYLDWHHSNLWQGLTFWIHWKMDEIKGGAKVEDIEVTHFKQILKWSLKIMDQWLG